MLLLLFRNCCRILWKSLNCQQYIIWLFLLFLLSQQHGSNCKPTNLNHRIQRRFMWKQMDSTVDGFVGHVVTGARVMKSMIGDFMPSKQSSPNVMDYLPTETTRIKYIIRNPHTKETKVIRIRPSKKVVKIMSITPRPQMADKQKSMHIMDPEKLRKLEREQELVAEGRIPLKHKDRPSYLELKAENEIESKEPNGKSPSDNEIVSGTIQEFGDSWKPVYSFGETPAVGFSTVKPLMMSALHTSITGELLPEPQKQVYDPFSDSNDLTEDDPKKTTTYEVTEYTAEESVVQPLTHDYYNHQSLPVLATPSRGSSHKHFSLVTDNPQIEDESSVKSYLSEYQAQRGFLPSRGNYRSNSETTTTSISTTTTTEEPNYPSGFLKKYREHPENLYHSKYQQRNKPPDSSIDSSWAPSNATYSSVRSRPAHYEQYAPSNTVHRTKSQKWPPDAKEAHQHTAASHDIPNTTDAPSLHEFTTQSVRPNGNSRKNVRLKSHRHTVIEHQQHSDVRQRGSVKYGDRIDAE